MAVSFVVHANSVRMRRITHHQESSIVTCSMVVSCRTTMFGPSMEKEGLCLIIMKKKRTQFPTLRPITVPSLKILQWVSLKKMLKNTCVEDDLSQMLREAEEV